MFRSKWHIAMLFVFAILNILMNRVTPQVLSHGNPHTLSGAVFVGGGLMSSHTADIQPQQVDKPQAHLGHVPLRPTAPAADSVISQARDQPVNNQNQLSRSFNKPHVVNSPGGRQHPPQQHSVNRQDVFARDFHQQRRNEAQNSPSPNTFQNVRSHDRGMPFHGQVNSHSGPRIPHDNRFNMPQMQQGQPNTFTNGHSGHESRPNNISPPTHGNMQQHRNQQSQQGTRSTANRPHGMPPVERTPMNQHGPPHNPNAQHARGQGNTRFNFQNGGNQQAQMNQFNPQNVNQRHMNMRRPGPPPSSSGQAPDQRRSHPINNPSRQQRMHPTAQMQPQNNQPNQNMPHQRLSSSQSPINPQAVQHTSKNVPVNQMTNSKRQQQQTPRSLNQVNKGQGSNVSPKKIPKTNPAPKASLSKTAKTPSNNNKQVTKEPVTNRQRQINRAPHLSLSGHIALNFGQPVHSNIKPTTQEIRKTTIMPIQNVLNKHSTANSGKPAQANKPTMPKSNNQSPTPKHASQRINQLPAGNSNNKAKQTSGSQFSQQNKNNRMFVNQARLPGFRGTNKQFQQNSINPRQNNPKTSSTGTIHSGVSPNKPHMAGTSRFNHHQQPLNHPQNMNQQQSSQSQVSPNVFKMQERQRQQGTSPTFQSNQFNMRGVLKNVPSTQFFDRQINAKTEQTRQGTLPNVQQGSFKQNQPSNIAQPSHSSPNQNSHQQHSARNQNSHQQHSTTNQNSHQQHSMRNQNNQQPHSTRNLNSHQQHSTGNRPFSPRRHGQSTDGQQGILQPQMGNINSQNQQSSSRNAPFGQRGDVQRNPKQTWSKSQFSQDKQGRPSNKVIDSTNTGTKQRSTPVISHNTVQRQQPSHSSHNQHIDRAGHQSFSAARDNNLQMPNQQQPIDQPMQPMNGMQGSKLNSWAQSPNVPVNRHNINRQQQGVPLTQGISPNVQTGHGHASHPQRQNQPGMNQHTSQLSHGGHASHQQQRVIHPTGNSAGQQQHTVIHPSGNSAGQQHTVIHPSGNSAGQQHTVIHPSGNSAGQQHTVIHSSGNSAGQQHTVIHPSGNSAGQQQHTVIHPSENSAGQQQHTVIHPTGNPVGQQNQHQIVNHQQKDLVQNQHSPNQPKSQTTSGNQNVPKQQHTVNMEGRSNQANNAHVSNIAQNAPAKPTGPSQQQYSFTSLQQGKPLAKFSQPVSFRSLSQRSQTEPQNPNIPNPSESASNKDLPKSIQKARDFFKSFRIKKFPKMSFTDLNSTKNNANEAKNASSTTAVGKQPQLTNTSNVANNVSQLTTNKNKTSQNTAQTGNTPASQTETNASTNSSKTPTESNVANGHNLSELNRALAGSIRTPWDLMPSLPMAIPVFQEPKTNTSVDTTTTTTTTQPPLSKILNPLQVAAANPANQSSSAGTGNNLQGTHSSGNNSSNNSSTQATHSNQQTANQGSVPQTQLNQPTANQTPVQQSVDPTISNHHSQGRIIGNEWHMFTGSPFSNIRPAKAMEQQQQQHQQNHHHQQQPRQVEPKPEQQTPLSEILGVRPKSEITQSVKNQPIAQNQNIQQMAMHLNSQSQQPLSNQQQPNIQTFVMNQQTAQNQQPAATHQNSQHQQQSLSNQHIQNQQTFTNQRNQLPVVNQNTHNQQPTIDQQSQNPVINSQTVGNQHSPPHQQVQQAHQQPLINQHNIQSQQHNQQHNQSPQPMVNHQKQQPIVNQQGVFNQHPTSNQQSPKQMHEMSNQHGQHQFTNQQSPPGQHQITNQQSPHGQHQFTNQQSPSGQHQITNQQSPHGQQNQHSQNQMTHPQSPSNQNQMAHPQSPSNQNQMAHRQSPQNQNQQGHTQLTNRQSVVNQQTPTGQQPMVSHSHSQQQNAIGHQNPPLDLHQQNSNFQQQLLNQPNSLAQHSVISQQHLQSTQQSSPNQQQTSQTGSQTPQQAIPQGSQNQQANQQGSQNQQTVNQPGTQNQLTANQQGPQNQQSVNQPGAQNQLTANQQGSQNQQTANQQGTQIQNPVLSMPLASQLTGGANIAPHSQATVVDPPVIPSINTPNPLQQNQVKGQMPHVLSPPISTPKPDPQVVPQQISSPSQQLSSSNSSQTGNGTGTGSNQVSAPGNAVVSPVNTAMSNANPGMHLSEILKGQQYLDPVVDIPSAIFEARKLLRSAAVDASRAPSEPVGGHLWQQAKFTDSELSADVKEMNQVAELVQTAEDLYLTSPYSPQVPIHTNMSLLEEWRREIKPYCTINREPYICNKRAVYRSANGTCNNLENSYWGSSLEQQRRALPAAYQDGRDSPKTLGVDGKPLPSAREVSNLVHSCKKCNEASNDHTVMLWAFGQFVMNDVVSTPSVKGFSNGPIDCCKPENINNRACFAISIPENDTYFRNQTCMSYTRSASSPHSNCDPGVREQINQASSWLDGSTIYGSSWQQQQELRLGRHGLLKVGKDGRLPSASPDQCVQSSANIFCLNTGSGGRLSPAVTTIHMIFHLEHNRLATALRRYNPRWSDERIFQEAKRIVTAEIQHITYDEFLRVVLGRSVMKQYQLYSSQRGHTNVYDPTIDPTVSNGFAVGASRFGYSQTPDFLQLLNTNYIKGKKIPIKDHFSKPDLLYEANGANRLVRWMLNSHMPLTDRKFKNSVRNNLFHDKLNNSLDLAALDIQRGRDHGLPSYNHWRRWCDLPPVTHFGSEPGGLVDHGKEARAALNNTYRHVDDIELYSGAMSETPKRDALVGPTLACIIATQFRELKQGDRFWYENNMRGIGFTHLQLNSLKKQNFSYIICKNLKLDKIQNWAFNYPSNRNSWRPCESRRKINLKYWRMRRRV